MAEVSEIVEKNVEEDPFIIAQRSLNIYKQIHLLDPQRKESFNQELLKMPIESRTILATIPGGMQLYYYINEVAQEHFGYELEPVAGACEIGANENHIINPDNRVAQVVQPTVVQSFEPATIEVGESFNTAISSAIKESQIEIAKEFAKYAQKQSVGGSETGFDGLEIKDFIQEQMLGIEKITQNHIQELSSVIKTTLAETHKTYSDLIKDTIVNVSKENIEILKEFSKTSPQTIYVEPLKTQIVEPVVEEETFVVEPEHVIEVASEPVIEEETVVVEPEPVVELEPIIEVAPEPVFEEAFEAVVEPEQIIEDAEFEIDADLESFNKKLAEEDVVIDDIVVEKSQEETIKEEVFDIDDVLGFDEEIKSLDDMLFEKEPIKAPKKKEKIYIEPKKKEKNKKQKMKKPTIDWNKIAQESTFAADVVKEDIEPEISSDIADLPEFEAMENSFEEEKLPSFITQEVPETKEENQDFVEDFIKEDKNDTVDLSSLENIEEKEKTIPIIENDEDYEWEYVEDDGSQPLSTEDYEWEYVEDENTKDLKEGEYEWEYVEE